MLTLDPDFGYHTVHTALEPWSTSSKIEALEAAHRLNGHVTFHFHDDIYSSFDWRVPITDSINDLYRTRAQQIRNQHQRVVLAYSGGIDSHNMLRSFLDNDIRVDAIFYFYNSTDPDDQSVLNQEWNLQTRHRIQTLQQQYPDLKFYKIDMSSITLRMIDDYYDDYYYLIGDGRLSPNSLGISFFKSLLPAEYNKLDTAMVWAIDKPRLRYHNNRFYFNFLDKLFRPKPIDAGSGIVYFYYSAHLPQLVIKQAQIARAYWQNNLDLITTHAKNRWNPNLGWVLDADHMPVQRLIYPYCDQGQFLTWRHTNQVFPERDQWLYRSNTEQRLRLQKIYHSYLGVINPSWCNQHDVNQGLIGHLSKDYEL